MTSMSTTEHQAFEKNKYGALVFALALMTGIDGAYAQNSTSPVSPVRIIEGVHAVPAPSVSSPEAAMPPAQPEDLPATPEPEGPSPAAVDGPSDAAFENLVRQAIDEGRRSVDPQGSSASKVSPTQQAARDQEQQAGTTANPLASNTIAPDQTAAEYDTTPSSSFSGTATILSDVNLRGGPGTENPALGVLKAGTSVQVVECEGWCQVTSAQGNGWIYQDFLDLSSGEALSDADDTSPSRQ